MRCCVPSCRNNNKHRSKPEGVTFHVLPTDNINREAWLKALNMNDNLTSRSSVCSEHFDPNDIYTTKSGLRRLRVGSVPLSQNSLAQSDDEETEETDMTLLYPRDKHLICRMCLRTDARLYSMSGLQLESLYQLLTGVAPDAHSPLPPSLCGVCAHQLLRLAALRRRALAAHDALAALAATRAHLSRRALRSLDRSSTALGLTRASLSPGRCDAAYTEDEPGEREGDPDEGGRIFVDEVEVKEEAPEPYPDFFAESPKPPGEPEPEPAPGAAGGEADDCGGDAVDDADYAASDRDSASSCDLPINQLKARKTREKTRAKKERKKTTRKSKKPVDPGPKVDRRRRPLLNPDLNETLFIIKDLTFEEQMAEIEKRKETQNFKNSSYQCNFCYKGFMDLEAFDCHMVRHTEKCGEHVCQVCKTHFKSPHPLRKHVTAHHSQKFLCNQCTYVTTHRQTARLHERWHRGIKYVCPHCQEVFIKFTTYMGHLRIKHPSDFVCELCGYSFVSLKGIDLHKKLKHRLTEHQIPEDAPSCELCSVRFISEDALQKHLQVSTRHAEGEGKEPKEVNTPKKSKRARDSTDHLDRTPGLKRERNSSEKKRVYPSQVKRAEGPIPCEQCGLQLEDSRAYHSHFRKQHPDKNRTNYPSMKSPCMCEVCGRMFQSFALLRDHAWLHAPNKPFKCDLCPKSFKMKQRLVAHRRVHSLLRTTYPCGVCGKAFSTISNKKRHMFIHTGLKPFKCEMCAKGFKHLSEKRSHVAYVHLKKPWPKRARAKRPPPYAGEGVPEREQEVWCAKEPESLPTDKHDYYMKM